MNKMHTKQAPNDVATNKMPVKGIVLAGGHGSRLYPLTHVVSKQLLPIYDKPMVYYPISVLMQAGIREILIITNPQHVEAYQQLLGDGSQLGVSFEYCAQSSPLGLAHAFILAEPYLNGASACLVLGDNLFFGDGLIGYMQQAMSRLSFNQATIFAYRVSDPQRYGVVSFDTDGNPRELEEKPCTPSSPYAVTGLYFFPPDVCEQAKKLLPSARGELEVTELNQYYLNQSRLHVAILGRGLAWLDTGTQSSLLEASAYIEVIEKRQGRKVACLEEIAFEMGFINASQLRHLAQDLVVSEYGRYLMAILDELKVYDK
jgi:glucose-1-phosphate thymidylyltransferase